MKQELKILMWAMWGIFAVFLDGGLYFFAGKDIELPLFVKYILGAPLIIWGIWTYRKMNWD